MDSSKNFQIGNYDKGLFDLADKVTLDKKTTVSSKDEAIKIAKNDPGSELIVERKTSAGTLSYDIYKMTIDDKEEKLNTSNDIKNLEFLDKPLEVIEKNTGTKNSVKAYIVAENGDISEPIYNTRFNRTTYDKMRENLGLDKNKLWFWLVDTVMGANAAADNLPPVDKKEINNMKSHLKPGDIILNGNDGGFIHGILYVGKDPQLQQQLEKKWNMPKGALKDEGIILHSLVVDEDKEIENNGKKEVIKAGGTGPIIDTIERFVQRHPRDAMIAVAPKDATDKTRKEAIDKGKEFVGKKYDRGFNTFDDKEMYCTEFVMKAWLGTSNPPEFKTQKHPLISYPAFILDKLPAKIAKSLEDGGLLYQEMIMTDGMAASPSMDIIWANKNMDKTEFVKKHTRWANGVGGKVNADYKKMLDENVPGIASESKRIVEQIKILSQRTRNEMK